VNPSLSLLIWSSSISVNCFKAEQHNLGLKLSAVVPKVTKERYAYVLVEDEKWWNRRCARNKTHSEVHSFVRRGKVGPKQALKLLFYIKLPAKQIKGVGEFVERVIGSKDELWNLYGAETVFENKDEYDNFIGGRNSITMIRFRNMEELDKPIDFKNFNLVTGIKKMPNGGMYISRENMSQMV
jgi:predicted transcriptional regulator